MLLSGCVRIRRLILLTTTTTTYPHMQSHALARPPPHFEGKKRNFLFPFPSNPQFMMLPPPSLSSSTIFSFRTVLELGRQSGIPIRLCHVL